MADKKISELVSYTTPLDADVLPIVDIANTSTKKVTWANIKATLLAYFNAIYLTIATAAATYATITSLNNALGAPSLKFYTALGSTVIGETVGISLPNVTTDNSIVDQVARFTAVYLPKAATITGVKWLQTVQGAYTADQTNQIGLYSYSAGTLTLVAASVNDGNIWKAAVGIASAAFVTPYAAAAGTYFVGAILNNSAVPTAPRLGSAVSLQAAALSSFDFTNSGKIFSSLSAQNALPSSTTMAALTTTATSIWFGLY